MTVKTVIFIIIFVIIGSESFAQTDSTSIDTNSDTIIILDEEIVEPINSQKKNPTRAFLYSVVVPGLGQAYNRKYWKIPIVYTALGGVAYFFNYNNIQYKRYLNDLSQINISEGDSTYIVTLLTGTTDKQTLTRHKDNFRRNRDLSALVFIFVYALNFIDATVDAHLSDFDISDDLSLMIKPEVLPIYSRKNNNTIGLTFSFKFY